MYLLYYIDKIKTVIENLFTKCTTFYKNDDDDKRIDELWEL